MFWSVVRAHHSDIGGATHGAYNPAATEIWHEGLRIPPMRLTENGILREDLLEIYPASDMTIDPGLVEIREFLCPVSGTLLDVDCVPPAFPVEVDFTPDLATFYRDWLGRDLPVAL